MKIWRTWKKRKNEYFPNVKMAIIPIPSSRKAGSVYNNINRGVNKKIRVMTFKDKSNAFEIDEEEVNQSRWMRLNEIHLKWTGILVATNEV